MVVVEPTIANIKEETCYRRSLPTLLHIPCLSLHNIRGFPQPRLIKVANAIVAGEGQ
jgi:hypothetical protein